MKPDATTIHDPFLSYVHNRIQMLLELVDLESNGKVITPTSLRPKNLEQWIYQNFSSIFDAIGPLSSFCNLKCKFCYEDGNTLPYEKTVLSTAEAKERIRYYDPDKKIGLPLFTRRLYKEPFTNKNLPDIIREIRSINNDSEITITTNGSFLNKTLMDTLLELKPVALSISLNAATPNIRESITGDKKSKQLIDLLPEFKNAGLPFYGSIVAWPTLSSEEIVKTIRYLDACQARIIRVTLPGYTEAFSKEKPFDTKEVWERTVHLIMPLRHEIKTPLILMPSLYHEDMFVAEIAGTIRNSPAETSGLLPGDLICEINEQPIYSRAEVKRILDDYPSKNRCISLGVERNGVCKRIVIEEFPQDAELYPYRPKGFPLSRRHPFGIVLIDDFDPKWIADFLGKIKKTTYENILLMTTSLMEEGVVQILEKTIDTVPELDKKNIYTWVPKQRYWGGNIILGDLLLCSDFIAAIRDFILHTEITPDCIAIPSSFSPNGYTDLLGVPYTSIETETQIPVLIATCETIIL